MKALRRAAARFREARSVRVLSFVILAIAVSAPLYAGGDRSRPNDSSGSERFAVPRSESPRSSSPPPSSPPPSSGSTSSGNGNNDGGSHRTAVPRTGNGDGQPSRQPPHDRGGRGGHGHGGYNGGYYGYPYNSWGPYWGWGWGWGWWGWWYADDYYYPYGPYGRDRYGYGYERSDVMGALDVDVSPGKTEVWIDGRYVGIADNFDGFPQYLWLDKGVYDLALFREGYKTISRQITIYPGTVIGIDDRMQVGDSVRPEDLVTKTHERRDERVRSEDERREEIARRGGDGMDDWRERARRRMQDRDRYDRGDRNGDRDEDDQDRDADEQRGVVQDGTGRLHLEVEPADASVYLDGKFIGTGIDLARLHQGLRLEPGEHRIAVVRPGRQAEEQELTVAAGQDVDLEIQLESLE